MSADLRSEVVDGALCVEAAGVWRSPVFSGKRKRRAGIGPAEKSAAEAERAVSGGGVRSLVLRLAPGTTWDSSLLAVFSRLAATAAGKNIPVDLGALPPGMGRMLAPALRASPRNEKADGRAGAGLLENIGGKALHWPAIIRDILVFLGEAVTALVRFFLGRASFSRRDLWRILRECGVDALPIVSLTSLLMGLILAFVSVVQLRQFGAEIYTAALVGVGMTRVMGPVLTGVVLAGRTGASFAAVIGSMQVNEEVDALVTFGISPMEFLVLPRLAGLALMTPLLAVYADIMGIAGGFLVGVTMIGITPAAYLENTMLSLSPRAVWVGLLHALVFGCVIALCGCYQGMRSGRSAEAVGRATTSAVVASIVGIIVSTSIITVVMTVIDL
jgi:phospholipid/cholesterol/gamma-HCH transport system permease protein